MHPIAFWRIETALTPPPLFTRVLSQHSRPECVSDIFLRDLRSWKGEGGGGSRNTFWAAAVPGPQKCSNRKKGGRGGGRFWAHARASVGGWEKYYAQKPKRDLCWATRASETSRYIRKRVLLCAAIVLSFKKQYLLILSFFDGIFR